MKNKKSLINILIILCVVLFVVGFSTGVHYDKRFKKPLIPKLEITVEKSKIDTIYVYNF